MFQTFNPSSGHTTDFQAPSKYPAESPRSAPTTERDEYMASTDHDPPRAAPLCRSNGFPASLSRLSMWLAEIPYPYYQPKPDEGQNMMFHQDQIRPGSLSTEPSSPTLLIYFCPHLNPFFPRHFHAIFLLLILLLSYSSMS